MFRSKDFRVHVFSSDAKCTGEEETFSISNVGKIIYNANLILLVYFKYHLFSYTLKIYNISYCYVTVRTDNISYRYVGYYSIVVRISD